MRSFFVAIFSSFFAIYSGFTLAVISDLDPSFNGAGFVTTSVNDSQNLVTKLTTLSDGSYLAGVTYNSSNQKASIAKLSSGGSLDNSFGIGGVANLQTSNYINVTVTSIKPDSNGNIMVSAYGQYLNSDRDSLFLRLKPNGTPDTTFNQSGFAYLDPTFTLGGAFGDDFVYDIALDSSGKILASGSATLNGTKVLYLTRMLANGSLDTSFGDRGIVLDSTIRSTTTAQLFILSDGKILVFGGTSSGNGSAFVARYNANGSIDTTFGSMGYKNISLPGGSTFYAKSAAIQLDGKLLIAGYKPGIADIVLIRLLAKGDLDLNYGSGGYALLVNPFGNWHVVADVTVQSDSKAIVVGSVPPPTPNNQNYSFVARINSNGTFDTTFGTTGGIRWFNYSSATTNNGFKTVAIDFQDRILAGGWTGASGTLGAIARLLPGTVTVPVVEFYNTNLDNYFITADANEAGTIDRGSAGPGWVRTGNSFMSSGRTAVCRFYGSLTPGPNSHFYTLAGPECDSLKQLQVSTPDTQKRWNFESLDFVSTPPTTVGINGACPTGTTPVYRAYNNGFSRGVDSNHRITSNSSAIQEVVARGWINEGVVMCAPSSP